MSKAKILYVEDDETLGFVTRDNLEQNNYSVTHLNNGQAAIDYLPTADFDLAILDVMLPDVDGFTIAEHIRKSDQQVPILFLTAKVLKEDRLHGFALGGDDYITKPFSIEELVCKIEVFLRRTQVTSEGRGAIRSLGKYRFDQTNLILANGPSNERTLTQREADLLAFLADQRNSVIRRGDILQNIWGEDDYFLGRSLDVFISRLRKYLQDDERVQINNIHGVGFKFICP